jgi:hypothetical protein
MTPFGEKITLTTTSPSPSSSSSSSSYLPPTVAIEVQFQNPTSLPILHQAITNRLISSLASLSLPPPNAPPARQFSPFVDVLDFQAKLLALQKTLHGIADDLTEIWGEKRKGKHDGKKDDKKKDNMEDDGETEELEVNPKKQEEQMKKLISLVGKCVALYDQSRLLFGTSVIVGT